MQQEEIFVPGRLCLFGEHSDWASEYRKENSDIEKGYALVATIDQGIKAMISKNDSFNFSFENKMINIPMDLESLDKEIYNDEFFSLVIATTKFMYKKYQVGGIKIDVNYMDLPMEVGLSSSSAICVLVVKAFNIIYNLNLSDYEVMEMAYLSERIAGFKCGRMDHVCALSKKLVELEFDKGIKIKEISPIKKIHLVFCVIKKKNTRKILDLLNKSYPYVYNAKDKLIQDAFGVKNKEIVTTAIKYIEAGDNEKLGLLMNKAQSIFDNEVFHNTDFLEVKLHEIVTNGDISKLILGAKGVGSHGDGAVQFLVDTIERQEKLVKTLHNLGYKAYKLDI